MNALTALGLLLPGVGGLVALWGLIKTHDVYAEKPLLVMASERAGRLRDRLVSALRRLVGRPKGRNVDASVAMSGGGAFNANAVIAYGPIADDMAIRDAIAL